MSKRLILILLVTIFSTNIVTATNYYWIGAASNANWSTSGNWLNATTFSNTGSPGSSDNAYIGVNLSGADIFLGGNQPTLSSAVTVTNLTIGTNESATLTLAASLTVSTALSVASGSTITNSTSGITLSITNNNSTITNGGNINLTSATLTLSANPSTITNNGTMVLTSSTLQFNQQNTTFNNAGPLTLTSSTINMAGNPCTFNNTSSIQASSTPFNLSSQNANFYNKTGGSMQISASPISLTGGSNTFNNAGTVQASGGSNLSITNNNNSYINNTAGSFVISGSTITMNTNPVAINNSAIFTASACPVIASAQNAAINNTAGVFTYDLATFSGTGGTGGTGNPTIKNSSGATFNCTGATISFTAGQYNNITNAGTFNAGSTTINLSANSNFVSNSGTFNLGDASVINITDNASYVTNTGTFTLLSGASSSATIGKITSGAIFNGVYNVQRHFKGQSSGTTADNTRNYRILCSPVNVNSITNDASANSYYNLQYLNTNSGGITGVFTAGPSGTSNGFTVSNVTPTIYLYKESLSASNTTFNGGNFKGLTNIGGSSTVTTYNDAGTSPSVNATLYAGNGYFLYYVGNNTANTSTASALNKQSRYGGNYIAVDTSTMTAVGTLNQGNIPVRLWWNSSVTTLSDAKTGFNMVGNPYASSIDLNSMLSGGISATNISSNVYIFNYASRNYGVYPIASGGTTGTNNASNVIGSGQGFFVVASSSSATLTFTEAAKTNTQPNTYGTSYLLLGLPAGTAQTQLLRVKVAKDTVNTDDIMIYFDPASTNAYEPFIDADRLNGIGNVSSLASYSSNSGNMLAINHMHSIDSTTRVKLYVNISASTATDTLSGTGFSTLDPRYDVYLLDHYKTDSLLFSAYPKYLFNIDNNDTTSYGASRFEIVFHKKLTLAYRLLSFTATPVKTGIQLTWTTSDEQNFTGFQLERADGTMQFLSLNSLQSNGSGKYSYIDTSPVAGTNYYKLQQDDPFNVISYSNIISVNVNGSSKIPEAMTLYPNPVTNQFNITINTTVPSKVTLKVTNIAGQTLINSVMDGSNIQQAVNSLLPGSYIVQVIDNSNQKVIGEKKFIKQ